MEKLHQYLNTTYRYIKNISGGGDIKKIKEDLEQLNIIMDASAAKDKLIKLNEEIKESLGMINFINQTIKEIRPIDTSYNDISLKLKRFDELINNIIEKRYIQTGDKLYLEIEKGQTWKILSDIFSVFIKLKEDIDKIARSTDSYDKVSIELSGHVKKVLDVLRIFSDTISKLLNSFNDAIHMIQKSVYDNYKVEDIIFVSDDAKISPKQFKSQSSYHSKFEELIVGYDGIISDATTGVIKNVFNNLQLEKIKSNYLEKLNIIFDKIQPLVNKKYDGIQTGGSEETIQNLYIFNIELQKVQKILNSVMIKWKEYQHFNYRFNNYFMYQIYCLTIPKSGKVQINYNYIDKNTLLEYKKLVEKIIINFNNFTQLSNEKERDATLYFNQYHYFTIKKLKNFFDFIIPTIETKIIDIRMCKKDVYHTFTIFNQFKNILDVYNIANIEMTS